RAPVSSWMAVLTATTGAASVAWATWLPTFLSQLSTPGNLSRSAENWPVQFLATPISFALGRSFAWRESPAWWLGVAAAGTLAAFVVPAALGAVRLRRHRAAAVLLLGWLLLPVAVPLAFAALGRPVYSHRYAAIGLPAFAVLVAAGYVNLRPTPRVALGVLAAALTAVSLYRYGTEPLKDDWRSAAPTILRGLDPGRLLVFDTAIEVVSFQHYAGAGEPREAVGLDSAPADGPALIGVRYRDGVRVDPVARDLAPDVFARDRICLVLCVPGRPEACHLALFRERGFELRRAAEYHRIRVLFLDREAGPPAPTPRGMP
ncbi:hypothetical protein J0H58_17695, partial [bacterium]|nr:hypothetical protein [bacterium]